MLSRTATRLIKLQHRIHKAVRADVRRVLGPLSLELKRYYDAYKREFRGQIDSSSKEDLLRACLRAPIILLGDYHTFAQSQRTALRLLREIVEPDRELILCLEMVPTVHQGALDEYMAGKITDDVFLKKIDYATNWGFPWENFKPLLTFARENNLPVLGLNHNSRHLYDRDCHAAALLAAATEARPKAKFFVLYGDLHLARGHLPKALRAELRQKDLKRKILTVFQNAETVYWRLAELGLSHQADVISLGRDRYCIMNAPPWVKLQSYLEWTEASALLDSDDSGAGVSLHDNAHDRLKHLCEALGLTMPDGVDFSIQTTESLPEFLLRLSKQYDLSRDEIKTIKHHVLGNRPLFIPTAHLIYLPSLSTNALNESVAAFAHSVLSGCNMVFHSPKQHFFAATLNSAFAYFGSKVLNHKRKCDMEDDLKFLLECKLGRDALPQEKIQRKAAKLALRHLASQREYLRTNKYRGSLSMKGPSSRAIFLEATRQLGAIQGEKLYASFIAGTLEPAVVQKMFSADLSQTKNARKTYLKIIKVIARAPLSHTSKQDLL